MATKTVIAAEVENLSVGAEAVETSLNRIENLALAARNMGGEAIQLEEGGDRLVLEVAIDALLESIGNEASAALEIVEKIKRGGVR